MIRPFLKKQGLPFLKSDPVVLQCGFTDQVRVYRLQTKWIKNDEQVKINQSINPLNFRFSSLLGINLSLKRFSSVSCFALTIKLSFKLLVKV